MRTNIDIDDDLMAEAMKASGQATKKGAVEQGLRELIRAQAFRELVEGLRGVEWDDGLGTIERLDQQRRQHAAEEGAALKHEE